MVDSHSQDTGQLQTLSLGQLLRLNESWMVDLLISPLDDGGQVEQHCGSPAGVGIYGGSQFGPRPEISRPATQLAWVNRAGPFEPAAQVDQACLINEANPEGAYFSKVRMVASWPLFSKRDAQRLNLQCLC